MNFRSIASLARFAWCPLLLVGCAEVRHEDLLPQNSQVVSVVTCAADSASISIQEITTKAGLAAPQSTGRGPSVDVKYNQDFSLELATYIGGIETRFHLSGKITRDTDGTTRTRLTVASTQMQ